MFPEFWLSVERFADDTPVAVPYRATIWPALALPVT